MTFSVGPFYLFRPDQSEIQALESKAPKLSFNFPFPGITKNGACSTSKSALDSLNGYAINKNRIRVGTGRDAYRRATDLLLSWRHFDLGWAFTNAPKVRPGAPVVVTAQSLCLWSMNPLRISSVEPSGRPRDRVAAAALRQRCAFAHTTLQGHQISGEERFTVEWRRDDDSVWYEIETVSKPATFVATLAQPVLRFYQRRFVAESSQAMKRQMQQSKETKL